MIFQLFRQSSLERGGRLEPPQLWLTLEGELVH